MPERDGTPSAVDGGDAGTTRRSVLRSVGAAGSGLVGTALSVRSNRSYEDRSGDGIPTQLETAPSFDERLREIFGEEAFDGFDPDRKDFLVDVRYVGDASIDDSVRRGLERLFEQNGIRLHWLEYPSRYDETTIRETHGDAARELLWAPGSFYRTEIEEELTDVAFQLIVIPGRPRPPHEGRVYSWSSDVLSDSWNEGWVNGYNAGNRAVICDRDDPAEQARLALHEIAHLVLCHDLDPDNRGVMGTQDRIDLTDDEWVQFRNGLDAVRDSTGYDVTLRPCLWEEHVPDPRGAD